MQIDNVVEDGEQAEKGMYNNSGADVDMNKSPDNKKSHERYTKWGFSFVAVLRCTKALFGIAHYGLSSKDKEIKQTSFGIKLVGSRNH